MDNIINTYTCFKDLSEEDIAIFSNKKTQVTYLKGETIIKQGAFAHNVIFIRDGLVRKFIQPGKNKQMNLRLVRSGEFMAFFTIFGENIYPYSAVAMKDTNVCMIEKETIRQILTRNPQFALEMTSRNYIQEHRYLDIISNLTYKQMRGKLASTLLYLASDEFKDDDVFECLTRQEIADFASVTIESAIKFIKEFEKENALIIENKKIIIKDIQVLEKISQIG
jgi:CRP/FNR family transcriptional regulator